MALERQTIEKKDFPIGRRGYDPEAVDTHLQSLADEIEELKRSARRRTETLASSASEQVRSIVEAAETSAADIQRQAEDEAREIRAEASEEARIAREQATGQAREYVGKVSESTAVMMQRLDAMESELGALVESLRTGANRLNADLQLLEGNLSEVSDSVAPRPRFEPEPMAPSAPIALSAIESAVVIEAELVEVPGEPEFEDEAYEEPALEPAASEAVPGGEDSEGARLIALNMALNGTPREETDRYLAENFELSNRDLLLDEVYASVEG
ncbi:MAG TPA: DivIVA domain-containing protein [Solirubrobacteraceae bacterium]